MIHHAELKKSPTGFALIATISVMVLLVLIALAMLSLTTIELRSGKNDNVMAEAKANARLALLLSIGELQKQSGSDTRITAPMNMLDENAPPLTGVWKSWEGSNHDSVGRPIVPDYSSKNKPATSGNGRFVGYLVSGAAGLNDPNNDSLTDLVKTSPAAGSVPILSEGTLGSNDGQVHLEPQYLKDQASDTEASGAMAWWISPENQKARLMQPYSPRTNDAIDLVEMGQSHSMTDPEVFGLAELLDDPEAYIPGSGNTGSASKALTLPTTALLTEATSPNPAESFHDLSTSAVGLLTNSATGGWRKDMSLLTERWDDIYASYSGGRLPLFRFSPDAGATSQVPKPTTSSYDPDQCTLYPWSDYSVIIGQRWPATLHSAASSWQTLVNYATSYKNFSYSGGVVESPFVWDAIAKTGWGGRSPTNQEFFNYKHKQRLYPQIARFQFLIYAQAREDPNRMGRDPTRYQLVLKYVPVVTLWNPYNIRLTIDNPGVPTSGVVVGCRRGLPGALAVVPQTSYPDPTTVPGSRYRLISNGNFQYLDVSGNFGNQYDTNLAENIARFNPGATRTNSWVDMRTMGINLPTGGKLTFEPGEVIMFSPDGRIDTRFGGTAFGTKYGYRPDTVAGREIGVASNLTADRRYWFLLRNDKYTQPYKFRNAGIGFSLSYGLAKGGSYTQTQLYSGIGDEYHNITALASGERADEYWPQTEVDEVGYSIGELASGPSIPLFSMSMGPRFTIGTGVGTEQNRPTRGLIQNDPLAAMTMMDPGTSGKEAHPVNGNFDMSYHSLSLGSTLTPNLSDSEGFIATGYQRGDGLTRLITNEIPLRPMASLVELQGWNPRGHNPYPPFQANLIGNSDATPLIPSDSVVPAVLNPNSDATNLQHDDAYCANHLLFDDWFVSSIAPMPRNLGGDVAKDLKTFYKDVMTGDDKLSNRSYYPISADAGLTESKATARVNEIINSPESFLKVASRLEVAGMFNVNSTSVAAWKALLGHAKNREEIALHGANGIESTTGANPHIISRGAVATDYEAGSGNSHSGQSPNASEFTGFRSLTDDQIEDLAEKIVEQIRLRGPFLSLSEFVNRQLSTNDDLSLAGAVQTAINNLENDPMKELRDPANKLSDDTMLLADPKLAGVSYEYPKAAEGSSAYGAPGWIRQADVLRPIAPVLSARDDTFTIRAYGDARDSDGNILARAWCEATLQRSRDFIDSTDQADSIDSPAKALNKTFGRKYVIKSFRWLNADEV